MQEQRKTEAEPSRNPETLGEAAVLDTFPISAEKRSMFLHDMRTAPGYAGARTAAMIDSRFAPLIEAAEAVVERFDNPRDYFGENLSTLVQDLRAAIANAKGGAK